MPRRNSRRNNRRVLPRRPRRRNGRGGMSSLRNNLGTFVAPPVYETRVVYTATRSSTASAFLVSPNTNAFLFAGNNLFDPDRNAALESYPVGHVQLGALYNRYQVIGSTFEVTINANINSSFRFMITAHAYSDNLPAGAVAIEDFSGLPLSSQIMSLGPNTGDTVAKISRRYKTSYVLSRPESQLFCAETVSGYATNGAFQPASQWFWYFIISNNQIGAITLPQATLTFKVTYHTRYYQPHMMTAHVHSTESAEPAQNSKDFDPCDCDEKVDVPVVGRSDLEYVQSPSSLVQTLSDFGTMHALRGAAAPRVVTGDQ